MSMNRSISAAGRQRGLAAVLAILVVALAASTAIYLVWQQTVALRQVENLDARAQIREIARAGTSWAAARHLSPWMNLAYTPGSWLHSPKDARRRILSGPSRFRWTRTAR